MQRWCRSRRVYSLMVLTGVVLLTFAVLDSRADAGVGWTEESQTVVLRSSDYRLDGEGEEQTIEVDGFGVRMEPGRPMLPEKRFLIGLPPGARALSVTASGIGSKQLAGRFRILPTPPVIPLIDPRQHGDLLEEIQQAWQRDRESAYGTDHAYPQDIAQLVGRGTLRKYAYACLSYSPFQYDAASGTLVHHEAVEVVIRYALPLPGTPESEAIDRVLLDTAADQRAARMLHNYDEIVDAYRPPGAPPGGPREVQDYVIITASWLAGTVEASDFVPWKSSLGHNVRVVRTTDSEIADQPGADLAAKIRSFLRNNYLEWGIEHVLIVGGYQSVPMRYCFPDPANHAHDPSNVGDPGGSVPTDFYYADLSYADEDSWDLDGDGYPGEYGEDLPDFAADVYVGRIPTDVPSFVSYALNKIVTFEQDTGSWKDHALHAGAILYYENQDWRDVPKIDGAHGLNQIEVDLMDGWTVSRYSERDGLDPSEFLWSPLTEEAFTGDWQANRYGVVNWSGHGWSDRVARLVWDWDDGDGVPESPNGEISTPTMISKYSSLDDDYPSIVFAVSCHVAYPEPNSYGNLGVDLATKPGFGASVGVLASTRVAWIGSAFYTYPQGAEAFCYEFNRCLIQGPSGPERVGEALYNAKFHSYTNYGWEHYGEHQNQFNYNLYGDPAMDRRGRTTTRVEGTLAQAGKGLVIRLVNHPNPFDRTTEIRCFLSRDSWMQMDVFNIQGQRVASLIDGYQRAGEWTVDWNPDATERLVTPGGLYFCRIRAADAELVRRMLFLK